MVEVAFSLHTKKESTGANDANAGATKGLSNYGKEGQRTQAKIAVVQISRERLVNESNGFVNEPKPKIDAC